MRLNYLIDKHKAAEWMRQWNPTLVFLKSMQITSTDIQTETEYVKMAVNEMETTREHTGYFCIPKQASDQHWKGSK